MTHFQGALKERAAELIDAGRNIYQHGWTPATSGNFSARLDQSRFAITASGRPKGHLGEDDILVIDDLGRVMDGVARPSAETPLHTAIYRRLPAAGAVLHVHSLNATLLSLTAGESVILEGYELLKAFRGIASHEQRLVVPVFPNDQDVAALAARVDAHMDTHGPIFGYLIAGHGLYTWGITIAEAMRYLEAFDFLFACVLRLGKGRP